MMWYNKCMYADENRANDVKRKVRDYWGDGYRANELFAYLARKDDQEDTKPKKIRAKSAVLHRKPDPDESWRRPSWLADTLGDEHTE